MKRYVITFAVGMLCAVEGFAHQPYERVAESFVRGDGISVSAVEHYVDGILGADPVSVQFRLPDGTAIAETERTRDSVVVRATSNGVEVYQFASDWVPIAGRVQQFDGYLLRDITTTQKRRFSPLVHTRAHLSVYLAALGFAAFFVVAWFMTGAIPKRGFFAALRVVSYVGLGLVGIFYALFVLLAPGSPLVLGLLAAICMTFGFQVRRCFLASTGLARRS